MNFSTPALLVKYGSWFRVQVAFYDFLFNAAIELCPEHLNEAMKEEVTSWAESENLYEQTMRIVEKKFKTPEAAWAAFLEAELLKEGKAGTA